MALSSKISTVHIKNIGTTWDYDFTTNALVSELGQVNYASAFDEAIDASLRSNIRGFRANVSLDWEKLHDSTVTNVLGATNTVGAFFDDLITSFTTDGDSYVQLSLDGTNFIKVIPDNLSYLTRYRNQIGRGSASLDFIGQELLTSIPAYLEAPSV